MNAKALTGSGFFLWMLLSAFLSNSSATLLGLCDNDSPGLCEKELTITGTTLTIKLTNTSPTGNGGFITADAFNLPGSVTATLVTKTNANFNFFSDPSINVQPFGTREFLLTTDSVFNANSSFEGGGSPNGGIPAGGSATFTFSLSAAVSEGDVFNSQVVRLRGFNNDSSDKDLVTTVDFLPRPIPEPSTLLLLGAGLVLMAALKKRID